MKIGSPDTKPALNPLGVERKAAESPRKSGTGAIESRSAEVALSETAHALRAGSNDPAFDTEKVQRMAQAIRDGQFKVNPERIADKLIANAQELVSPRSQ